MDAKLRTRWYSRPWLAAAIYLWLALSVGGGLLLAIPATVPASWIERTVPRCERVVREARPCAACGLTRAFYAMSRGEVESARAYHSLGPPLYAADWCNGLAAAAFAVFTVIRGRS